MVPVVTVGAEVVEEAEVVETGRNRIPLAHQVSGDVSETADPKAEVLVEMCHRESFHQLCLPWTTRHQIAGQGETLSTVQPYVHTKNVWHKH